MPLQATVGAIREDLAREIGAIARGESSPVGSRPARHGLIAMSRARRFLRRLGFSALAFGVLLCLKLAWFHWMMPAGADEARTDVALRRAYLIHRVANEKFGVADMPTLVASPYREELAIATLSMTTVALTNLSFSHPDDRSANRDAVRVMLSRILSSEIRRYDIIWWGEDAIESLDGAQGHIGYLGHLNLMLGCYFLLGGQDEELRALFQRVSATLARRLTASGSYSGESFPGWTYTADNVVVILSLRLHDLANEPAYADLIGRWLVFSKERMLDPDTGMIRYHVSRSGQPAGTARGVLQAWNSMWLPLIDAAFGRDQYQKMRRHLRAESVFGDFAAIREYPAGRSGPTDLVSGPLIFGLSPSATGFAMGGAALANDQPTLTGLLRTAEMVGSTVSFGGKRWYGLAPLPGDAVVLAARTMTRWDTRFIAPSRRPQLTDHRTQAELPRHSDR
jgi:hypothetical protein